MDLIKFNPAYGRVLNLNNADIIEGWDSLTWVERYLEAGEFTLVADASSHLRDLLPIGSLISHLETFETMIVENHEISTDLDGFDKLTITGRSFETFLEQRIVGANRVWPSVSYPLSDIVLPIDKSWVQAVTLINSCIGPTVLWDIKDSIENLSVIFSPSLSMRSYTGNEQERVIKRDQLYKSVLDLLSIDNCGLRSLRPSTNLTDSPYPISDSVGKLILELHVGINRSSQVYFSHEYGDILSADYFWSNKADKNAALISGRWVEVTISDDLKPGYDRRWMFIDASDIDGKFTEVPVGTDLADVKRRMLARGHMILGLKNPVELANPKLNSSSDRFKYRKDYQVGDLVGVFGQYSASSVLRVIEYVEIEDENGQSGYPTLAEP